jgi:hypothetical protein
VQATEVAKSSSYWVYGNKMVINLSALPDSVTKVYDSARMMTEQIQKQQDPERHLDSMTWLRNGMAAVCAAEVVRQAGIVESRYYHELWLKQIGQAYTKLSLLDLQTPEGWKKASALYGVTVVDSYAALAAQFLADQKGYASFKSWLDTKSGKPMFNAAFGMSIEELSTAFNEYIKSAQSRK